MSTEPGHAIRNDISFACQIGVVLSLAPLSGVDIASEVQGLLITRSSVIHNVAVYPLVVKLIGS